MYPHCVWSSPNLLPPFLHPSSALLTAGEGYIFLPYICRDFCLLIDLPLRLSGSIRTSVYSGNINTSAPLSLSIPLSFFLKLTLHLLRRSSFPGYTPRHHDLVFPLWHSEVYFSTIAMPTFPYFFLILLLFVFSSLTLCKLPKTVRAEIAFSHMGLKKNIYTVALSQTLFDTTDLQTPSHSHSCTNTCTNTSTTI